MEPDSSPPQPEGSIQDRRCRLSAKWYVAGSLVCSIGSIVSKFFLLSLAARRMMAIARREPLPQDRVLMGFLSDLALILAVGGMILAIPVVLKGNPAGRVAVVVAILAAVLFLFVMV